MGPMIAAVDAAGALTRLDFLSGPGTPDQRFERAARRLGVDRDDPAIAATIRAIDEYFAGRRRRFDLPLAPEGSPFQHEVWAALRRIPYGATTSYGVLAERLGRPGSARAVGRANATNPIAIIVPCHRVIGASGHLTGYAGGLPIKQALLRLEGALPGGEQLGFQGL
ncbi:MAG: methylated-DNA--[protein]-cysteine S-methyltransferase [Alphaproteobacteria bacterium]|nr:methylated-DNA--[protein]-cysteine S-methyltransferase [Alphaproteobacteria bacterium]